MLLLRAFSGDGRPMVMAAEPEVHVATRVAVRSITADSDGTVIAAADTPDGCGLSCRIPVRPDEVAARRWKQAMRRIYRVEIDWRLDGDHRAVVRGVGHRRETARSVSVGTALGLGLLGVPVVLDLG